MRIRTTGMLKTLRSLRSIGRSKKSRNVGYDDSPDDPPRPSEVVHLELCRNDRSMGYTVDHGSDLERGYYSDSSLFQGFKHSSETPSPRAEFERRNASQHDAQPLPPAASCFAKASPGCGSRDSETESRSSDASSFDGDDVLIPGWPLMKHSIGFDVVQHAVHLPEETPAPSPVAHSPVEETPAPSAVDSPTTDKVKPPRSPLHRMFSDLKRSLPSQLDRSLSIVDRALKLPSRTKDSVKSPTLVKFSEDLCTHILREIALDAFRVGGERVTELSSECSAQGGFTCLSMAGKKGELSPTMAKNIKDAREAVNTFLAQKLDSLCSDQKCTKFSYAELEAGTSSFSSRNVVGRGGGSEVYRGKMANGKLAAVKRLNGGPQAQEEMLTDVAINTSLSHPHIVSLLGYCADSSNLILVYDFLPEGNLEDRLHAAGTVLPWHVRYKVAVGTAKALDYLHHGTSRPVIHRDVKSSNILLTAAFESQLSDFGLAKWSPEKASHLLCDDILGTFGYLAPEYFMYGRVSNKTDVYAFGVVLLELITGRPPIDNNKPKGEQNLLHWARPLLEETSLEKLVDSRLEGVYDEDQMKRMRLAASLCVQESPQRRPHMSQVLQILCSSHGRLENICTRPEEGVEDDDTITADTPTFGRKPTDIQTHLALAMVGVDDDLIARSGLDLGWVDRRPFDGRFSLPPSLVL